MIVQTTKVMLDWGVDLAAPMHSTTLAGKAVWAVTDIRVL
jgi:hypothetical protein